MKSKTVLVTGARQVVTMQGPPGLRRGLSLHDLAVVAQGALLIREGKILSIGPARRVENLSEARGAEEIDVAGCIILPGFVDCYSFPASVGFDNWENGQAPKDAPRHLAPVTAMRQMGGRRIETVVARAARDMARYGTTSTAARSGLGLDETTERKILKAFGRLGAEAVAIHPVFYGARLVPPEYQSRAGEYLEWIAGRVLPRIARHGLARSVEILVGDGGFPATLAGRYLREAGKLGFSRRVSTGLNLPCDGVAVALEAGAVQRRPRQSCRAGRGGRPGEFQSPRHATAGDGFLRLRRPPAAGA